MGQLISRSILAAPRAENRYVSTTRAACAMMADVRATHLHTADIQSAGSVRYKFSVAATANQAGQQARENNSGC
jgi:hypothetical protein